MLDVDQSGSSEEEEEDVRGSEVESRTESGGEEKGEELQVTRVVTHSPPFTVVW